MALQVHTTQLAHTDQHMWQVSPLDNLIMICGSRDVCMAGIVSGVHGLAVGISMWHRLSGGRRPFAARAPSLRHLFCIPESC